MLKVYLGVMPEEVSPLIKGSLDIETEGSTLVISRTNILNAGELLEQNLVLYQGLMDGLVAVTTDKDLDKSSNTDILKQLAKNIRDNTSKINIKKNKIPGFKFKMDKGGCLDENGNATISVAKIGEGEIKKIFIQLPEMGFQSNLCYLYGKAVLDSLKNQFPEEKISLSAFAAGGAISNEVQPGNLDAFSHCIGIRVHNDPTAATEKKFYGKVSICDLKGEKAIFQTDGFKNPYEAQEFARFAFLEMGNIPKNEHELSSLYISEVLLKENKDYKKAHDKLNELLLKGRKLQNQEIENNPNLTEKISTLHHEIEKERNKLKDIENKETKEIQKSLEKHWTPEFVEKRKSVRSQRKVDRKKLLGT